jgi:HSP20 family protein
MANLARSENMFDDLFDFRRDFDGVFNRLLKNNLKTNGSSAEILVAAPPIEARVDAADKTYHLRIALPGVSAEEVKLNLQGNSLTVSGEHKATEEKNDSNYLQREFFFERFQRTVPLPEDIDTERISAEYKNGVLEIVAPIKATALPKQIEIKTVPIANGTAA